MLITIKESIMKTKYIFLPLITIAALYFSACQKDFTIDGIAGRVDSVSVPSTGDSIYLTKSFFIEWGNLSYLSPDTVDRQYYQYDNLKRLITVLDTNKQRTAPLPEGIFRKSYFYNGLDTLPFKSITFNEEIGGGNPGKDTITSHYLYNSNALLILDSTISSHKALSLASGITSFSVDKKIIRFSYLSNKIYVLVQNTNLVNTNGIIGLQTTSTDTATLDGGGNIISVNSSLLNNTVVGALPFYLKNNYTYDNKPSPFFSMNIKKLLYSSFFGSIYSSIYDNSPVNNILKVHNIGNNSSIYDEDASNGYVYKQNGYPSSVLDTINSPGFIPYPAKQVFFYSTF